jgi:putative Mn2+ efflux pump MntP
VAAEEPVTAPDQHKPGHPRAARIGAVVVALSLLAMIIGNHRGRIEDWFLAAFAVGLLLIIVGDWLLRKNGLRP